MAQKVIDIQSFAGGEADSPYKGPANSFYQGEGIEVRKNMNGTILSSNLQDTGWSIAGNISCQADLTSLGVPNGGVVICDDLGNIYLDGVLKTTLASSKIVLGIGVNTNNIGNQYVYYVTQTAGAGGTIHRSTTNLATWNVGYRSYTVSIGLVEYVGIVNDSGLLYIAVQNKVFIMDKDEIVNEYLAIGDKEVIKFFARYLYKYKIYANLETSCIQYVWNGIDEITESRQEWKNQPILGGQSDGVNEFVVLGYTGSTDLYKVEGTQKSVVRVNIEGDSDSRVLEGNMSIKEGILYISGGATGESTNYGVYTYGNYYPGTNNSLVQSYSAPSGQRILFHTHINQTTYFSCTNKKVYKISHLTPPSFNYTTEGYVVSLMFQGNVWDEYTLDYFKIAFELNYGEIKIYARTDLDDSFVLLKTLSNASYGTKKRAYVSSNEIIESGVALGNFNEIQFKFVLTRNSGGFENSTPVLKRFTALLNITTINS